ncbi:MAG: spore germination protein GerW family protein [Chloroflexi bacterium]|nr:spore germination protein GerW family protein [Chloroflexota bacterium]
MEDVERLLKGSAEEMEKLLSSKTVVGEPLIVNGNTVVPLLSIGSGFGAGGGSGKGKKGGDEGEGSGGGTGGGGGVKPVAVIIINDDGVRVEPVAGPPSTLEKVGAAIGAALQKRDDKSE